MGKPFVDITDQVFGRLTVVKQTKRTKRHRFWKCRCSCNKTRTVRQDHLGKKILSCGCLRLEQVKKAKTTHGMTETPEYNIWCLMKKRCYNPNDAYYHRYGGRGIRVCAAWRKSFQAFLKDMGRRPSDAHSIDRFPDNDGNYKPGNCRWATAKQQANNRS